MAIQAYPTGTARQALTRAINHTRRRYVELALGDADTARQNLDSGASRDDVETALAHLKNDECDEASYHLREAAQRIDATLEVGR